MSTKTSKNHSFVMNFLLPEKRPSRKKPKKDTKNGKTQANRQFMKIRK
jgi:hypothetical protein